MDRPKDCFMKCPVFYQAPLPIPLLEINIKVLGGCTRMFSNPTLTNGSTHISDQINSMSDVFTVVRLRVLHHGFSSEAVYQQSLGSHGPSDGPSRFISSPLPVMAGINHRQQVNTQTHTHRQDQNPSKHMWYAHKVHRSSHFTHSLSIYAHTHTNPDSRRESPEPL